MMKNQGIFIPRESILSELSEAVCNSLNSVDSRKIIMIQGEAGTGKSTLLNNYIKDLKNRDKKLNVLLGNCINTDAMPYLPFVEALRGYFKLSGADLDESVKKINNMLIGIGKDIAELAPIVGPLLTIGVSIAEHTHKSISTKDIEVQPGQNELFYIISQLLVSISQKKPVILVLEDLHWADKSSIHLLQYLATRLQGKSIAIVITKRTEDIENITLQETWTRLLINKLACQVDIGEFTQKEFDDYICQFLDGEVSVKLKNILKSQTAANPFFLSTILPVLLNEKVIVKVDGVWSPGTDYKGTNIPKTVDAAVEQKISHLDDEKLVETLRVAAVIGKTIEYNTLHRVSGLDEIALDKYLDEFLNQRILFELEDSVDIFDFIHDIVRTVVYSKISTRKKRLTHHKIAEVIEELHKDKLWDFFELLAFHYRESHELKKAEEYYLKAGEKAIGLLAYDEALNAYENALVILDTSSSEYIKTLRQLTEIAEYTSQPKLINRYGEMLLEASQLSGNNRGLGDAYEAFTNFHYREGRWEIAKVMGEKHLEKAIEIQDSYEQANALLNLGRITWRLGDWVIAEKYLKESIELHRETGNITKLLCAYSHLGVIYRNKGELDLALATYQEGIDLANKTGAYKNFWLAAIYNNQGTVLKDFAALEDTEIEEESDKWDLSIDLYNKSLEISEKVNSLHEIGNTLNNIAIVYSKRKKCDLTKALSFCDKSLRILSTTNAIENIMDVYRIKGVILNQQKDFENANIFLEKSLQLARGKKAPNKEALALMELGILERNKGNKTKAKIYFKKALSIFSQIGAVPMIKEVQSLVASISE